MEFTLTIDELYHLWDATDLAGETWEGVGNKEAAADNEKIRDRIRALIAKYEESPQGK